MRKRSGAIIIVIILVTIVIISIVCYHLVPAVKEFIDANTALATFLGLLIGIPSFLYLLYLLLSEKKKPEPVKKGKTEKDHFEEIKIPSPVSGLCLGRDTELSRLETGLTHKNILLIKGIPGSGKTTLGLELRDTLEQKGYHTLWYQCDSESYEGFLIFLSDYVKNRGSSTFLSLKEQSIPPGERLKMAVQELYNYPTVLFLDNFQKFKNDSDFRIFKDHLKNSTLVLMSRTQPMFLLETYESLQCLDRNSSVDLLKTLDVTESPKVLEKIYEKTQGHPWSLVHFAELSRVLPVKDLLEKLPDFGKEQHAYISEECWKHLNENERDFLMRASVFTKPLTFEALKVCTRKGELSEVLFPLVKRFYIVKREYYYVHDIMKDFAFSKLKENLKLYSEAERAAADYYKGRISAENLLLIYDHLKKAGNHKEGLDSIIEGIDYFWKEGFWSDVRDVLRESLDFFKDEKTRAGIYFCLGTIVQDLGEWDTAIDYYEKSLEISEKLGDIHGMALTYGNLGLVYAKKGEWDKAIDYYEKSLEISEKLGDIHGMALTYNNLGSVYADKGEWDKAIDYYEKSLEISEKLGDIHGMAQTYNNLGSVYADKGEWDKAIDYYEKNLEISEKLGDIHGMAQTYNNLGLVYAKKGEWDKAIDYYEKSLEISEKLGDIHGMAQTYGNLGLVYAKKGEWDKAIDYYEKSLEISEKVGDIHGMAQTYNNLGSVYADKGEWDKAIDYYEKSLEIKEKLGDIHGMAQTYNNLGSVYADKGEWDKAIDYYEKDLEISEKLGDIHGMAITWENLAEVYCRKSDVDTALNYCNSSFEILEKLGDKLNLAEAHRIYGIIFRKRKELMKSKKELEKSIEICQELSAIGELADTFFELAMTLHEIGDIENAEKYFKKALEIFKKLKVKHKIEKIEMQLKSI
ncbi:MAG: tetratricopeptide repeat protein [Theionarchaea archaeon]|nr:tetratricopeptide repeat protein [Theionarchaea archaeon]